MKELIKSSVGTKMTNVWNEMMCNLAYHAVKTVATNIAGKMEVDIKRYARIEKVVIQFYLRFPGALLKIAKFSKE